jgi:hypothetical protein
MGVSGMTRWSGAAGSASNRYSSCMVTRSATQPMLASALLALSIVLTGCSAPVSVANDTSAGGPPGFDGSGGLLNGEPSAIWISGRREFAIVTFGSSSCAPVPTAITSTDATHIAITFVKSPNTPCTADFAPTTHKFDLPKGLDADGEVAVDVTYDFDADYHYALVLPAP